MTARLFTDTLKAIASNRAALFQAAVLLASLAVLYYRVVQGLVYDWIHNPDSSIGFFIPIASLYFVYMRRKELSALRPSGSWAGSIVFLAGILLFFLGNLAAEYYTMRVSMLVVLGGMIFFLLGREYFKVLFFPVLYLVFMIPLPSILMDRITFPMQLLASRVAANTLHFVGIPVLREGNVMVLANTSLEVAEACSGIRSLIALLGLSVFFAYRTEMAAWKRLVLILSTFPIAIVANAARVSGTGILAHYYDASVAEGFFHGFSGVILFGVTLACILCIESILMKIKR